MSPKHILMVGCGSVGQRHARNFAGQGCAISIVDPRPERLSQMSSELSILGAWTDLTSALRNHLFDGVAICSPTVFHVEQTSAAIEAHLPVLLEKPVAMAHAEALRLHKQAVRSSVPVLVGYTWRWWEPLHRVRQLLDEARIGALLHVQFHMSAHLEDWHPGEPLGDFFMSRADLGGGAVLDESHWLDLMTWMFGRPWTIQGSISRNSDLTIDSDDTVDAIVRYRSGPTVTVHLDLYGRPHEKFIRFIGTQGTLLWSAVPNRIRLSNDTDHCWKDESFGVERNAMFVAVAQEFLSILHGSPVRTCTLQEGVQVMEIIDALRTSSSAGVVVELPELVT